MDCDSQPRQGLRLLWRCPETDERRDVRQEHRLASHLHPPMEEAIGHGQVHLQADTMDCHQLYDSLCGHLESVESMEFATLRLPTIPYRSQHSERDGDTKGSQAAQV